MKSKSIIIIVISIVVIIGGTFIFTSRQPVSMSSNSNVRMIQVVAGENFWGSLVSQLGGDKVSVVSVVSDPNADPHEYESNTQTALAFANANYIILNGAGYDSWGDKLISANSNANQKVLKVADLLGKKEGDNPHFWYSPDYVNTVVLQMKKDLETIDPKDSPYFESQYQTLTKSLSGYQNRIQEIKTQFGGTKVAATEDIFAYLATPAGLDLISPPEFIQAVAEGNDPPAQSIVEFENQLKTAGVKVLVYNQQTVTPVTENMKKIAAEQGIPVIGITETIQPQDVSFQDWMNSELISLTNALNANVLGQ